MRADIVWAILLMGVASHACRFAGFFLMRYVTVTPGVEAWLRAIPLALIGAILGPVAAKGGPPEWAGLAAAIAVKRVTGNDFACVVAAVVVVALLRWAGL